MTEPADVLDVPLEVLAKIRPVCVALPQAYEEQAWVGTRFVGGACHCAGLSLGGRA